MRNINKIEKKVSKKLLQVLYDNTINLFSFRNKMTNGKKM